DIWPSNAEITEVVRKSVTKASFKKRYADVFKGDAGWRKIKAPEGVTYDFDPKSTYVQNPPFFAEGNEAGFKDVEDARILALLGDSITTDHVSPAGSIKEDSPAGRYLKAHKVKPLDFNSYGSRRGNHEVMMRGTFANIRIKNEMVPGVEGGVTKLMPQGKRMDIYDAAMEYQKRGTPLVVIGGKEYGTGSSRDWAAKGTNLLGVKAVITESFERIHRSNLVGMGVLPLQFPEGVTRKTLKLDGSETISLSGLTGKVKPRQNVTMTITRKNSKKTSVDLLLRIDTANEIAYYEDGGILQHVMKNLAAS
ncbi:MAG: aconitate hydratase, partial [Alphaproteobacteria bacterium]